MGSSPTYYQLFSSVFYFFLIYLTLNYSLLSCILSEEDNLIFGYPFLSQPRGGSWGWVPGVGTPPPPSRCKTCGFLIQLVFCKKKIKAILLFIGVEVEQETSTPPPKKILDPPLQPILKNLIQAG